MHSTHSKIDLSHFISEPFDFTFGITEDYSLGNGKSVIEVAKSVKFPFFFFDSNEKLFNSVQCEFISFDKNIDGI